MFDIILHNIKYKSYEDENMVLKAYEVYIEDEYAAIFIANNKNEIKNILREQYAEYNIFQVKIDLITIEKAKEYWGIEKIKKGIYSETFS